MQKLHLFLLGIIVGVLFQVNSVRAQAPSGRWDYYNSFNGIVSMADDGDYFWVSTWGGMVRFKKSDGSYQTFPGISDSLQGYAGGMVTSPNGTVWRWADNMIGWWDGSKWNNMFFFNDTNTIQFTQPQTSIPRYFECMAFDSTGKPNAILADGYHPQLLARFDGTKWNLSTLPNFNPPFSVAGMLFDKSGALWLTGNETTIATYDDPIVARIRDTNVTVWTESDSIASSQNTFSSIALDSTGKIWTANGSVSVFNGTKWTEYNTQWNGGPMKCYPYNLLIDPHNYMTVGYEGVEQFDGTNWAYSAPPDVPEYISSLGISSSGELWATGDSGAYQLTNGAWKHYTTADGLPSNNCSLIVRDAEGEVLVATDKGVARFANGTWTSYAITNTITGNQIEGAVHGLATDHTSHVFVTQIGDNGANQPGVLFFDGTTWRTFTTADGLLSDTALDLACDPLGRMWLANQTGVSVYDNGNWRGYALNDSRNSDRVYQCIAADSSGNLWVGCVHSDLVQAGPPWIRIDSVPEISHITFSQEGQPPTWKTYGLADIPYFNGFGPISIASSKTGDIWAIGGQDSGLGGFVGGLYHYDGTTWNTIDLNDGKPTPAIQAGGGATEGIQPEVIACAGDGAVWMICNFVGLKDSSGNPLGPIVRYDGTKWEHFGGSKDTLPGVPLTLPTLCAEPGGQMLVSTNFGVVEYDGTNWSVKYATDPGPVPGNVTAISNANDGSTWLGTQTNGIAHFIPGASSVTVHSEHGSLSASVYPNPMIADAAHISLSGAQSGVYQITLVNTLGIVLKTASVSAASNASSEYDLSTSNIPSGAYLITIAANGSERVTLPVVKE